eukprot:CAMPEP_0205801478 /NCGR_PEP_ID=MMETSP0205-20121125/3476_1 /ASSEMBLY_ACC=CAM_ASM_000278 /TAXON_ID=36767 /ORGANISM="Euplotes focardii, Strain TN1" /LENGTH=191 /DNA_ID=CAMNT_0053066285 /DNA_START=106 /DNA_END=678 /DNA_ORIENTATION=+
MDISNSQSFKQIELSMVTTDRQIEEAKLQVAKELAKLDQDTSMDESLLLSEEDGTQMAVRDQTNQILCNTISDNGFGQLNFTQEGSVLTTENGNVLTPSQNKSSGNQTSRELRDSHHKTHSESFMNYSLSDEEMEMKLKQSIANLISAAGKGNKDLENVNELNFSKESSVEKILNNFEIEDSDPELSDYLS